MSQEPEQTETRTTLTIAQSDDRVALQLPLPDSDEQFTILLTPDAARELASSLDMVADLVDLGPEQCNKIADIDHGQELRCALEDGHEGECRV